MTVIRSRSKTFVVQGTLVQVTLQAKSPNPYNDYRCGSRVPKQRNMVWYRAQLGVWTMKMPSSRISFRRVGDLMFIVPEQRDGAATLYVREEFDWVQRGQRLLTKILSSRVAHTGITSRHLVLGQVVLS